MLVIGTALLLGAAILVPLAYLAIRRANARRALAELRPSALVGMAGDDVTLSGVAVAGPNGVLESRLAGAVCVWHGHEVLRHFATWEERQGAERERVMGNDSIADHTSPELFGVVVSEGARPSRPLPLLVDPEDAHVEGVHMCLQRVIGRPQRGVPAPADDLLGRVKGRISGIFRGETIEFEYREWVIRPGDRVTVRGRVELREGHPVLVAPRDGRLGIALGGTEEEAPPAGAAGGVLLGAGAAAAGVAGLALVLVASL
ncbi:hypothetical protein [Nocardiopsis ansamitocini]|uniref:RING-type E3 ubiquitin transferase n=1 Tax=Nocardiopsis ansamitocini TaxID=1670832 RepID=A0A9W6UIU3_9ACTN|nr:hypothetical protein [Nocardiopsis ansamitocini]GLU47390.1 hypothetical protein Nans01_17410 [Nocardiopsis ansamitocini]